MFDNYQKIYVYLHAIYPQGPSNIDKTGAQCFAVGQHLEDERGKTSISPLKRKTKIHYSSCPTVPAMELDCIRQLSVAIRSGFNNDPYIPKNFNIQFFTKNNLINNYVKEIFRVASDWILPSWLPEEECTMEEINMRVGRFFKKPALRATMCEIIYNLVKTFGHADMKTFTFRCMRMTKKSKKKSILLDETCVELWSSFHREILLPKGIMSHDFATLKKEGWLPNGKAKSQVKEPSITYNKVSPINDDINMLDLLKVI